MSGGRKSLIVAPYVGEFGWELMNWQGHVRWAAAHGPYDRVVILAETDRRALYVDAASDGRVVFHPMAPPAVPGHRNEDHRVDDDGRPLAAGVLRAALFGLMKRSCESLGVLPDTAEVLMPDFRSTLWPTSPGHQLFAELRVQQPMSTDVVLVPRVRHFAGQRNRPMPWWEELADRLRDAGLTVEIYAPRLDEAIRQLSRARLAAGASTGGLHLASLCRCPHYVWGGGAEERWTRLGMTNRQRYETIWNPFGTPCRYDESGWQPALEYVVERTLQALEEIGLPRGRSAPAWSLKPKWRVKRRLAQVLEPGGWSERWPWRVRQAVWQHVL